MAKDEWQQPDKIGAHPKLSLLAKKLKELSELENQLLKTVRADIEKFNEVEIKRKENNGS